MKIVVGYVRTAEGRAALEAGIREARAHDATLVVAHSLRGARRDAQEARLYRTELETVESRLEEAGVDHVVRDLIRDKPAPDDLIDLAAEERADLLVIGIRQRSPVGKLVLGSNAQDILLQAECAVLAVKAGT